VSLDGKCPTGCGRQVARGHLMCRPCWAKVPKELQQRVYVTWRAWRKDFADETAMAAYREARENAMAAIA